MVYMYVLHCKAAIMAQGCRCSSRRQVSYRIASLMAWPSALDLCVLTFCRAAHDVTAQLMSTSPLLQSCFAYDRTMYPLLRLLPLLSSTSIACRLTLTRELCSPGHTLRKHLRQLCIPGLVLKFGVLQAIYQTPGDGGIKSGACVHTMGSLG